MPRQRRVGDETAAGTMATRLLTVTPAATQPAGAEPMAAAADGSLDR